MKSLFFLPLVLLLLCNITSSCSSSKSKEESENDSIAIAKLDSLRQDSLRQDSIRRRDFLTPDLVFHDLHGDVKRCIQSSGVHSANDDHVYNYNDTLTYDEKGNWINEPIWPNWVKKYYPEIAKKNRVVRNHEGQITRIYCDPECDDEYESFEWDGEKLAKKGCKYNDYGLVTYSESDDDHETSFQWIFYDYVIDDMGNWVERKYFRKDFNLNYPYNIRSIHKGIDTREIEYFNSNGGKITSLPNNDLQKQALTEYREYERKKASKNEDYDDYSASSSNKVTSYTNQQYDESPSFRIPSDVSIYLSDKTFKGENYDGDRLSIKIKQDCVYANGAAITAAPRISIVSPTKAIIKASNVYAGGSDIIFYLDSNNGTLTLQSGEKLYLSK